FRFGFFLRLRLLLRFGFLFGTLGRHLRREGAVVLSRDPDTHRRRAAPRLRIEDHRQDDDGEQDERHRADQAAAATALQGVDVFFFFSSHAVVSPTVWKEPKTMILSFSPAPSAAAANASAGEACRKAGTAPS